MIECFSMRTAIAFGNVLEEMYRLRYQIFIKQEGYCIPSYNGLESDDFDTDEAVYFVHRDSAGNVIGTLRALPTTLPYMIQQLWPDAVVEPLPVSRHTWEATRIGVSKSVSKRGRRRIVRELLLAQMEFGLQEGINSYIGIMPPKLWKKVFVENGWPVRDMGPTFHIECYRYPVTVGEFQVSAAIEREIRSATGMRSPVLSRTPLRVERTSVSKRSENGGRASEASEASYIVNKPKKTRGVNHDTLGSSSEFFD